MRASQFMNTVVTDDGLLEILVRLPDARTAIQASAVCQRWRSLILNPYFVRFFTKHRSAQNKKAVAFFNYSKLSERSFHQLSLSQSEEYNYSESQTPECDLSFKPSPRPPWSLCQQKPWLFMDSYLRLLDTRACKLVIRACCDDLVLLSSTDTQYYICNWLTKEVVPLPPLWSTGVVYEENGGYLSIIFGLEFLSDGYALVRSGSDYRVLILKCVGLMGYKYVFTAWIFDTETHRWSKQTYSIPTNMEYSNSSCAFHLEVAVTTGGVVHWLCGMLNLLGLVAFDAFTSAARLVPLPAEGGFGDIYALDFKHRVRLGTVQGRLWLSQMIEFHLRIWELDNRDNTWRLVRDVAFSKKKTEFKFLCVLAFDPNDDNSIFLMCDKKILRYVFDRRTAARVCEIPCYDSKTVNYIEERVARDLNVLTVVHPSWPSSISQFREY